MFLGISEATLKRFADAKRIPCVRQGKGRRFDLLDLMAYLRRASPPRAGECFSTALERAAAAGDVDACVTLLAELRLGGFSFAAALERLAEVARDRQDALRRALGRAHTLGDEAATERPLNGTAIVCTPAPEAGASPLWLAACLLRGRRLEVLAPSPGAAALEVGALAARTSAQIAVVATSDESAGAAVEEMLQAIDAQLRLGGALLLLERGRRTRRLPRGAIHVATLQELDDVLSAR